MHRRLALLSTLFALLVVAPASARVAATTITGWTGAPGPSKWDRLDVTKFGPSRAKTVLVLVPGTSGGRGDFALTARELVADVPGLAVWTVDRRSNQLEDVSVFRKTLAGQVSLQGMLDYYLNSLAHPEISPKFQPPDQSKLSFMKKWGLRVQLEDVRRVVRAARRTGARVVLGGHSLGASVTAQYAAWDFNGRAGYRDLDGLVLIDGGVLGTFSTPSASATRKRLAALARPGASPFLDLLGVGLQWISGVFAEVGAVAAKLDPTGPSVAQTFPLLPATFKPPMPATNRALLGYAFDEDTSPKALSLIHVRAGSLAESGDPRDWADGEVTPVARLADTFAFEPGNAVEWYFPNRLTIDVDAAQGMRRGPSASLVGAREWHTGAIDIPMYALQTSLTGGRVLKGARALLRASKIPRSSAVLVDASATESHLDPLTAAPDRNEYLKTVVPFLKKLVR